jgi:molecular chaperone HscB
MVDPFETLGIAPTFEVDLKVVEKRYRELARVLHPDRHLGSSPGERRMNLGKAVEVNEAWRLVRNPIRRAEALLRRHGVAIEEGKEPKADPEFLMEMMEQREALSEARGAGDPAAVERLAGAIRTREKDVTSRIAEAFAAATPGGATPLSGGGAALPGAIGHGHLANSFLPNGNAGTGADNGLAKIVSLLGELRYYRRFLDEVSAIEDGFSEGASAVSDDAVSDD